MHVSVMKEELVDGIFTNPDGVYVDATGGAGGHSEEILKRLSATGRLIVSDCDARTHARLEQKFKGDARCKVVRARFSELDAALKNVDRIDGLMADVGISSDQLDDAAYGIGFKTDGPLDMRLDERLQDTAADLVNTLELDDLTVIFRDCGEERHAHRVARSIVDQRAIKPFETTGELKALAERCLNFFYRGQRIHPATRIFQGLRIAVNSELGELESLLKGPLERLNAGGRAGIISFHSLEDRIVKWRFKELAKGDWKILTKRPLTPSEEEEKENPRSRSAKLRVIERGIL